MSYCGPRGIPLDQFREWDEGSYAAALAWQTRQNNLHTCGQPLTESTLPEMRDGYTAIPKYCGGCAAIARASRKLGDSQDRTVMDGVHFTVVRDD